MLPKVYGYQLRSGMVVYRDPFPGRGTKPEIIGKANGGCEKGRHFGSGCYDRISVWYRDVRLEK
jgi:hypothetical protein